MNQPTDADRINVRVRSDQWNGQDFIAGPRIFTIARVNDGKAEQQFDIELVEGEGRVWRPPSTVLHLLIAVWGPSRSAWVGRRVELYRDPKVAFGKDVTGGIRVSAVSHIDKAHTESIMVARGRFQKFTVQPLPDAQPVDIQPHLDAISQAVTIDDLKAAWESATVVSKDPRILAATNARKAELTAPKPEQVDQ